MDWISQVFLPPSLKPGLFLKSFQRVYLTKGGKRRRKVSGAQNQKKARVESGKSSDGGGTGGESAAGAETTGAKTKSGRLTHGQNCWACISRLILSLNIPSRYSPLLCTFRPHRPTREKKKKEEQGRGHKRCCKVSQEGQRSKECWRRRCSSIFCQGEKQGQDKRYT